MLSLLTTNKMYIYISFKAANYVILHDISNTRNRGFLFHLLDLEDHSTKSPKIVEFINLYFEAFI